MDLSSQLHALVTLIPELRAPCNHWIMGCIVAITSLDATEKEISCPLTGMKTLFPKSEVILVPKIICGNGANSSLHSYPQHYIPEK
jgi:hypothetical protein